MFVGVIYIVTGWTSAKKLAQMKKEISEDQLEIAFKKYATDDKITTDQFWDLVVELGIGMKRPVRAFFFTIYYHSTLTDHIHRKLKLCSFKLTRTTAMRLLSMKSKRGILEEVSLLRCKCSMTYIVWFPAVAG